MVHPVATGLTDVLLVVSDAAGGPGAGPSGTGRQEEGLPATQPGAGICVQSDVAAPKLTVITHRMSLLQAEAALAARDMRLPANPEVA
jgi:hypothetical protein